MIVYPDLAVLLNFLVDFLLLIGANRLCGYPAGWKRALPAALVGGIYAGICLLPGFWMFSGGIYRILVLFLIGAIAYGLRIQALRMCIVFVILSMSLGGVVTVLGSGGILSILCAMAVVLFSCIVGIRNGIGVRAFVPVEIWYQKKKISFVVLRDTGNELRDPLTGEAVLIVDRQIAQRLLGLSQRQLTRPAETLPEANLPGLRLISYRTVGQSSGLMLAMRFEEVRVGKHWGSMMVAFAPQRMTEGYEGLIGGTET